MRRILRKQTIREFRASEKMAARRNSSGETSRVGSWEEKGGKGIDDEAAVVSRSSSRGSSTTMSCWRRALSLQRRWLSSGFTEFQGGGNTPQVTNINEVKEQLLKKMGIQRGYRPLQLSRAHLLKFLPATQKDLPPRRMQDSFSVVLLPLTSDILLQEKYVTNLGQVRLGRLMEDMDTFAAYVAHKHISNPGQPEDQPTPYVLVTVMVDQIDFTDVAPKPDADIRLSGHVSWVGTSSIEVTVWLDQFVHGSWQRITSAVFLMASRNSTLSGPAPVNALQPETDSEKAIFDGGEARKRRRMKLQKESLLKMVPDQEEQRVIHNLFQKTINLEALSFEERHLPPRSTWMSDTKLGNIVFSHPEHRNLHNKVFGGFLMRQALELSWMAGYLYGKFRPKLCHISNISFHRPVDVGSLLRMNSMVTYTESNYLQIMVYAEVFDPHGTDLTTTNVFQYTYQMPEEVVRVIPRTYKEAMMYLDGRRHFQHVMGLRSGQGEAHSR